VPEGLSISETGKEIKEHAAHGHEGDETHGRDRLIAIAEAILLSIVTIVAAWSGYAAAKWGTEASLNLAKASATRTEANRAFQTSVTGQTADAVLFNAWFGAHITHNVNGERLALRRFRPQYRVAFDAWLKTHPFTNPNAPPGPQAMPQYKPTGAALSKELDREADDYYADGQHAGETGDKYIRTTVILASVLFLVGISSHFHLKGIRVGLVTLEAALLIFAAIQILQLPAPP
jgi:hypothetical protein